MSLLHNLHWQLFQQLLDHSDIGRFRISVQNRNSRLVCLEHRFIKGKYGDKRKSSLYAILAECLFVTCSPHLVCHDIHFWDSKFLRQCCYPARCFQGTVVRLSDNQQDIGVSGRATAHVLDGCLHIDDRELALLLNQLTQYATHGGMCPAESALARVFELNIHQQLDPVSGSYTILGGYRLDWFSQPDDLG